MPSTVLLPPTDSSVTVRELSRVEVLALIDRQARRFFNISGEEFLRRWRAGTYAAIDTPAIMRLVPLVNLLDAE